MPILMLTPDQLRLLDVIMTDADKDRPPAGLVPEVIEFDALLGKVDDELDRLNAKAPD